MPNTAVNWTLRRIRGSAPVTFLVRSIGQEPAVRPKDVAEHAVESEGRHLPLCRDLAGDCMRCASASSRLGLSERLSSG